MPTPPFGDALPYPSRRRPVYARNVVATSQPLAAQAGLEMLRRGGNAMDAAVATAAALTVVEPTSNGIGSDAFALIWAGGGLHGLNASGRAPRSLSPARYAGLEKIPTRGWDGVTTPGAVSGWVMVAQQFGKLPLETLLAPAVRYARDGFLVSPEVAYYWGRAAKRYTGDVTAEWRRTFAPNGRAPRTGEQFRSPNHAATLEAIASTGGAAFYRGPLAERIGRAASEGGGDLRVDDLASHAAEWVRPIAMEYQGVRLHEIPPNGQGIVALIALGILRHHDIAGMAVDSVSYLHHHIEAMKLAFRDGHRYVADPAFMDVAPADLLDDGYLAERARLIDADRAQDFGHGTPKPGGTILLTTADAEGNMVSFIQSNYTGFGSGVVVPGTGIALQNRGCCFTLEPGHPNEAGPGKRPYHTIIPAFVTRPGPGGEDVPLMAYGVMGGFMQPQGHAQVLSRIVDHDQNPQAALDAPRWRVESGLKVTIEPGFDPAVYEGLRALGHDVTIASRLGAGHGRGQVIYRLDDGYLAASDQRADGQAVGF
ncbi:MAG: gamma-glutamyltransferase family protein [Phycisphaerales bacterium]|nr:gamma-glutamyltransferase family protein [Phycisphaerales bacterium]